ncbi:MAG TPA: gamma-glutamylcyclotransferase [Ureibacillus sp.]|nr:gamma-glutamylcyclotransferase [Ureibacillus sp.]
MKVFVYGTLRKGEENNHFLKNAICLNDHCWTFGLLYDSGYGYPAMIPSMNDRTVGELYEVTEKELSLLDELEDFVEGGTNNLYERVEQEIYTNDDVTLAYVYIANNEDLLKIIVHKGDWKEYRQKLESK